ncbi:Fic family protein [Pectinatus frisingensis]|uniref:Fic family protein n=1 Tax=Pectinatus frisingensis TaxID=865 RepID=UPI0018C6D9E9|nr:Fic family protein [Pectinatus frisingensis]
MDFTQINNLSAKLKTLRPLNAGELKRLHDEFIIDNTYNSNAIEGNTLTLRETALVLQEGITIAEKPLKDHLEAIGHKDAFQYVLQLVDKNELLSEHIIKDIHALVLMNDAANRGVYRRLPVRILGSEHTPPQPYLVPVQMEQLVADYTAMKDNCHIIEAVAELHARFETIHPFIDGNGRTGRLMLNFELMKAGLLPVNIKFTDRYKYYAAFDAYHKDGNAHVMAELIMKYETEELEHYIAIIEDSHA